MQELTYLERAPRQESAPVAPVIFLLHGRAAYAKTIFTIEGLLDPRLHVIAIEAPYASELGGFEWFRPNEQGRSDELRDADHFTESEEILTAQIEKLISSRPVDPARVFLLGFSQGAAMSFIISLRGKINVKGAVPMGGFLPSPIREWREIATNTRFLIAHGDKDEVLPEETSIQANEFLLSKGIRSEFYSYRGRHKMSLSALQHVNAWLAPDLQTI
jgi:phospholipase/carboxylesterase